MASSALATGNPGLDTQLGQLTAQMQHLKKPSRCTGSVMASVACATLVTGFAIFIISAMACAGATSPATLGKAYIAAGAFIAIGGITFAASQLNGTKAGKSMALKIVAGTAALCALPLIFGSLTRTGFIPLKVMGWLTIGPLIAAIVCGSSSGSSAASFALSPS